MAGLSETQGLSGESRILDLRQSDRRTGEPWSGVKGSRMKHSGVQQQPRPKWSLDEGKEKVREVKDLSLTGPITGSICGIPVSSLSFLSAASPIAKAASDTMQVTPGSSKDPLSQKKH